MLTAYLLPLAAVQILWINPVTEGTLTLNLVMEGAEGDEMRRKPIRTGEPLITHAIWRRMVDSVFWTEEIRKWFARRKMKNAPQVG